MKSKRCTRCLILRPLEEFHAGRSIGNVTSRCKHCRNEVAREKDAARNERRRKGDWVPTPALDLTGQRFGRLTALRRAENDKQKKIQWLCVCDCGVEKVVRRSQLRIGSTRSCGCLQQEVRRETYFKLWPDAKRLPPGEAAMRERLKCYKSTAKRRGFVFALTHDEVRALFASDCYYCGVTPSNAYRKNGRVNGGFTYNGIDRVDNTRGYESDNVVACCHPCNYAKGDRDQAEFLEWARKIAAKH